MQALSHPPISSKNRIVKFRNAKELTMKRYFFVLTTFLFFLFHIHCVAAPHSTRVGVDGGFRVFDISNPKRTIANAYFSMWIEQPKNRINWGTDPYKMYTGGDDAGIQSIIISDRGHIISVIVNGVSYNNPDPIREWNNNNQAIRYYLPYIIGGGVGSGFLGLRASRGNPYVTGLSAVVGAIGGGVGAYNDAKSNFELMDNYDIEFNWLIDLEYTHGSGQTPKGGLTSDARVIRDEIVWRKGFRTDYPKKYNLDRNIIIRGQ